MYDMNRYVIIIFVLILGFSLDACKHTKQKSPVVQESSVSEDSVKYIYEGILPAADAAGIRYTLTISAPQNSGDGTFVLQQAYLGTGEKDTIFTTTGRRYTHRGDANDINATVWQLKSDNGNEIFNFLYENDSTLILLKSQFEKGLAFLLSPSNSSRINVVSWYKQLNKSVVSVLDLQFILEYFLFRIIRQE